MGHLEPKKDQPGRYSTLSEDEDEQILKLK